MIHKFLPASTFKGASEPVHVVVVVPAQRPELASRACDSCGERFLIVDRVVITDSDFRAHAYHYSV